MKVLLVEPKLEPYSKEIGDSLSDMQKEVGGLIEIIELEKDVVLVGNEEGKILSLEGNRSIGNDIIAGTFFVCGSNKEGDLISLTDEQMTIYFDRFKEPEHYTEEEVEDSIYMEVYTEIPDENDDINEI